MNIKHTSNFVPIITRTKLEDVAQDFLERFCPDALKTPMPVPIVKIAEEKMKLTICNDYNLSENLRYLGCTVFTDGNIEIYDSINDEFKNIYAKAGTIIIDKDVIARRNIGSYNYTLGHECIHWDKHRKYYQLFKQVEDKFAVAHRSQSKSIGNPSSKWTDEDWMEWQAERLPGYILMPQKMFIIKAKECIREYNKLQVPVSLEEDLKYTLARFFNVSEEAALIRYNSLKDLGLI